MEKKQARKICFDKLGNIENKQQRDLKISEEINGLIESYDTIGIYSPIRNEIVLSLREDKNYVYPVVVGKEMEFYSSKYGFNKSDFGILEPIINDQEQTIPDVLIVPCVGYFELYRLGYGGGFYDRYLEKHELPTIGIAYKECQLVSIELNEFDLPLDKIVVL